MISRPRLEPVSWESGVAWAEVDMLMVTDLWPHDWPVCSGESASCSSADPCLHHSSPSNTLCCWTGTAILWSGSASRVGVFCWGSFRTALVSASKRSHERQRRRAKISVCFLSGRSLVSRLIRSRGAAADVCSDSSPSSYSICHLNSFVFSDHMTPDVDHFTRSWDLHLWALTLQTFFCFFLSFKKRPTNQILTGRF